MIVNFVNYRDIEFVEEMTVIGDCKFIYWLST